MRFRGRIDGKTEAERKMERERYERERIHTVHTPPETRSRSPFRTSGARESRRDVWDERDRPGVRVRTRSDERSHRRETVITLLVYKLFCVQNFQNNNTVKTICTT